MENDMTITTIEPMVLDVNDDARALRLGASTVRAMLTKGELPSVRIGDRRLIRVEDLRAFLAERVAA
jgi:excisionase family DNA binding protein